MSEELRKRISDLESELEQADGDINLDDSALGHAEHDDGVAGWTDAGADEGDDTALHHPAAVQAGDSGEDTIQGDDSGQAAVQAGADEEGDTESGDNDQHDQLTMDGPPKGFVPVPEYRRQMRQLSGAEKRANRAEQELAELQARLQRTERVHGEVAALPDQDELLRNVRDGDPDAVADALELLYQRGKSPAAAPATDDLPVYYSDEEEQVIGALDAMNDPNAQVLADWIWAAKPRTGQPQADPQAAQFLANATRIEKSLLSDPASQWMDRNSLMAEVVRRAQAEPVTGNNASAAPAGQGQNAAPAAVHQQAAAAPPPPKKRTPQSLSAAAGITGRGQASGGNSVAARYESAPDKVAFMRTLSEEEVGQLYD